MAHVKKETGSRQPADQWMQLKVTPPPNCPPGLEYLTKVDQMIVKQQVEPIEGFIGFETNNKYKVKNSMGQNIFIAVEDNDSCTRNCCGNSRAFDMRLLSNCQREIIHFNRPLRCTSCCFPCFLQKIEVTSPPGTPIGYVIQKWTLLNPTFEICDASRNPVLKIKGPICTCRCCGDVIFQVLAIDGKTQVGRISKQWGGIFKEVFADADTFGATFPMDLDVKMKATMLAACFLIDFLFFESSKDNQSGKCTTCG